MSVFGAALRAAYPEAEGCVCTAEGARVPPEAFRIRTMNFGQHWRTPGIVDVAYRAELPAAFLRDLARRELPAWMDEARTFPDEGEMEDALRAAGWPSPDDAVADRGIAVLVARTFAMDLLGEWFDAGRPTAEPGYLLNTADAVHLAPGGGVIIEGRARRADVPAYYQDL